MAMGMRLAYNAVLLILMILFMAFATVSSNAKYPGLSSINFTANPYLDTTCGPYSVNLTVHVYDASGNPVADGTAVNFKIVVSEAVFTASPTNDTARYYPVQSGNLNGNNSQYASVPTGSGKATVRYGWFPDNKIPTGFVKINAELNDSPGIGSTLYLQLDGTTHISWTIVPVIDPGPSPLTLTQMPDAAQNPLSTPLSPMVTLISLTIGAAIVSAVRKK